MFFMARRVREPAQYTDLSRCREFGQGCQDGVRIQRVFAQDKTVQFHYGHTRIVGLAPVVVAVDIENKHVCPPTNQAQQILNQELAEVASVTAVYLKVRHSGTNFADTADYDGYETREAVPVTQPDADDDRTDCETCQCGERRAHVAATADLRQQRCCGRAQKWPSVNDYRGLQEIAGAKRETDRVTNRY